VSAVILLDNARIYRFDRRTSAFVRHGSLLIDGAAIAALDADPSGASYRRVDLGGATVLPAFADCHVHLTDTGHFAGERNLATVRSYGEFAASVERLPYEPYVLAGQYDESTWNDRRLADVHPLEKRFPDAYAMLVRVDGHSCIVNAKTLAWLDLLPEMQGIERDAAGNPTGKLFLEANWRAQARFMAALPLATKRAAERRAVELALSRGYLHLHAQLVGFARDEYAREIAALRDLPPAKFYPKICEPDAQLARELRLPFVGGDVFLDGSIGSCTAAVTEAYAEGGSFGSLTYGDDQVYAYFAAAEALGVSAGVHAIGDRAIEQCIATWERVLGGKPSPRGTRHFIEHFEIARPEHIEACARMKIYISMQPQFDALWGGTGGMYERRLGTKRMRTMNALGRITRAGAVLCGGDDSPVCSLSPLEGMQAALDHHEPQERLGAHQALAMYTINAAHFGHAETVTGNLEPGLCADLAVLDNDPLDGVPFTRCRVLSTWSDGDAVYTSSS
jgi:predicted amidohydrolase YtcJ